MGDTSELEALTMLCREPDEILLSVNCQVSSPAVLSVFMLVLKYISDAYGFFYFFYLFIRTGTSTS